VSGGLGVDDPATTTDQKVQPVPTTTTLIEPVTLDVAIAPCSLAPHAKRSR
jgi:hypothetical protein